MFWPFWSPPLRPSVAMILTRDLPKLGSAIDEKVCYISFTSRKTLRVARQSRLQSQRGDLLQSDRLPPIYQFIMMSHNFFRLVQLTATVTSFRMRGRNIFEKIIWVTFYFWAKIFCWAKIYFYFLLEGWVRHNNKKFAQK